MMKLLDFKTLVKNKKTHQYAKMLWLSWLGVYIHHGSSHWLTFFVGNQLKASELKPIMEDCVIKMSETGFHVEAISSDMGLNFLELASSFGVIPENPEFKIEILNLLYIFDPCHLVKATRNNLLKHSFHFEEKRTSWEYIDNFL